MENSNIGNIGDINHYSTLTTKFSKKWYIPVMEYYVETMMGASNNKTILNNIDATNGIISEELYKKVLAQLNAKEYIEDIKDLDIIDGMDIISPIVRRYMGEYIRQPEITTCVLKGDSISLEVRAKTKDIIMSKLIEKFTQLIKQKEDEQSQQGEAGKIEIDYEYEFERIKNEFYQNEVEKANNLLTIIKEQNRIPEKLMQSFYYIFATNKVYAELKPKANNIEVDIIPPYEYFRFPNEFSVSVEDDIAGLRKYRMGYSEILNEYEDEMTLDQKDILKTLVGQNTSISSTNNLNSYLESRRINFAELGNNALNSTIKDIYTKEHEFISNPNAIDVYKLFYITKRKIGTLTYLDETGKTQLTDVSDDYTLNTENGDVSIEWNWLDEVFVQIRIHDKGVGIYLPPKPFIVQRHELEDVHKCSLPIIGFSDLLLDYNSIPICASIITFQALYKILQYKINKEISKFKGFVNVIPESILSDSSEFTVEQRLQNMYADNTLIFNDSEVDVNSLQGMRTIGSNAQFEYVKTLVEIAQGVKRDAMESADMNQERYGEIDTRGGKGNTEQAIIRMSTGSLLLFSQFDNFKERLYQAIIDYARLVFVDGVNREMMQDGKIKSVSISHQELMYKSIGIYVKNSQLEQQKVQYLKQQLIQAASQNGEFELAVKASTEENIGTLQKFTKKLDEANKRKQVQMKQVEAQIEQAKTDREKNKNETIYNTSMDTAKLKGEYDLLLADKKLLEVMVQFSSFNPESNKYVEQAKQLENEITTKELELQNLEIALKKKKLKEVPKAK